MERAREQQAKERVETMQSYLRGSYGMAAKVCELAGNMFAPGCPAETEWIACGEPLAQESRNAHLTANLLHTAAADCLEGLARLLPEPTTQLSVMTTARSCIELSVRGAWLLDPAIDGRERAARELTDQLISANRATVVRDEARTRRSAQEDALAARARALGFTVVEPGRLRAMTVAGATPPNKTESWRALFGPLGAELYRRLSGSTHGTAYSLLEAQGPVRRELPKPFMRKDSEFPWPTTSVALAIVAYLKTFERQVYLLGWAARPFLEWRDEVWDGLTSLALPTRILARYPQLPGWEGWLGA